MSFGEAYIPTLVVFTIFLRGGKWVGVHDGTGKQRLRFKGTNLRGVSPEKKKDEEALPTAPP